MSWAGLDGNLCLMAWEPLRVRWLGSRTFISPRSSVSESLNDFLFPFLSKWENIASRIELLRGCESQINWFPIYGWGSARLEEYFLTNKDGRAMNMFQGWQSLRSNSIICHLWQSVWLFSISSSNTVEKKHQCRSNSLNSIVLKYIYKAEYSLLSS